MHPPHLNESNNFLWLLVSLVLLLFSGALFDQFFGGGGKLLINLSITATLLVAVWSLDNLQMATYYSFVSLTSLGYGDITPAVPLTRFLAYMEAIFGHFYLAVLVASLIGGRLSSKPG